MPRLPKTLIISIVDDDESVRDAAEVVVRSLGYAAATFASAEEYLRSGRMQDTSCLIADVQMPGMSGLDLQARLIADGYRMPIIFVTAFPKENVRARALQAGAIGFLVKPFSSDRLIECIGKAFQDDAGSRATQ
jgi:FixJ family two-component response regulator